MADTTTTTPHVPHEISSLGDIWNATAIDVSLLPDCRPEIFRLCRRDKRGALLCLRPYATLDVQYDKVRAKAAAEERAEVSSSAKDASDPEASAVEASMSSAAKHGLNFNGQTAKKRTRGALPPQFLSLRCRKSVLEKSAKEFSQQQNLPPLPKDFHRVCRSDINALCGHGQDPGNIMDCLRTRFYEILHSKCVDALRKQLDQEPVDGSSAKNTDPCRAETELFCHGVQPYLVAQCLQVRIFVDVAGTNFC